MFNKTETKGKTAELETGSHNTIGAGTIIKGEIIIEGNVRIDGSVHGSITSKGKIVVGKTGKIEGEVECQTAAISGEIKGKFITHDLISIKSSAKLEGDIYYGKIEVDKGATIDGSLYSSASHSKKEKHENIKSKIAEKAQELIKN